MVQNYHFFLTCANKFAFFLHMCNFCCNFAADFEICGIRYEK